MAKITYHGIQELNANDDGQVLIRFNSVEQEAMVLNKAGSQLTAHYKFEAPIGMKNAKGLLVKEYKVTEILTPEAWVAVQAVKKDNAFWRTWVAAFRKLDKEIMISFSEGKIALYADTVGTKVVLRTPATPQEEAKAHKVDDLPSVMKLPENARLAANGDELKLTLEKVNEIINKKLGEKNRASIEELKAHRDSLAKLLQAAKAGSDEYKALQMALGMQAKAVKDAEKAATRKPKLTDEQKELAKEVAKKDKRTKELGITPEALALA